MLVPAVTRSGAVLRMERSAALTTVATLLRLFSEVGSLSAVTCAVLTSVVPGGVPTGMWPTRVKVAVTPAGNEAVVHVVVAPPVQFKLGPVSWVIETKVIGLGSVSVRLTVVAA